MIAGISAQLSGQELLKHEEILPRLKKFSNVNLNLGVKGVKYVLHNLESFSDLRKRHGLNFSINVNFPIDLDSFMIFDDVEAIRKELKAGVTANLLPSGLMTEQDGKQVIHRYELYSFRNVLNKLPALSKHSWNLRLPKDHYRSNDFSIELLKKRCEELKMNLFMESSSLDSWRESEDKVVESGLHKSGTVFASFEDVKKKPSFFDRLVNGKQAHTVILNSSEPSELERFQEELIKF